MQFRQKARRSFAAIAAFVLLIFTMAIPIGAAEAEDDPAVSNVQASYFYSGGFLPSSDLAILDEAIIKLTLRADDLDGSQITSSGVGTRFNAVLPLTQSFGINPSLIISAFDKDLFADVCRTGFYTADKTRF